MDPPSTTAKIDIDAFYEKKKESRNCCCKLALIIIFLAVFAGAIIYANFKLAPKMANQAYGTSEGYLRAALHQHMSVNKSANPCDDFYEHACGNYIKKNPIPPHMMSYAEMGRLEEESEKNMKILLDSPEKSTSSAINKMKLVYTACLNQDVYVPKAPKLALETIKKYGSWPLLEGDSTWDPSSFDFQDILEKISKDMGFGSPVFSFELERDRKNQTLRALKFDQTKLFMKDEYLLDPKKYAKEWKAMKKLLVDRVIQFSKDIGIQVNPQLEKEIDDIFAFQAQLAKIMKRRHERRDSNKMYNPRSFKEFNQEFKELMNFDLKKYALAKELPETHSVINNEDAIVIVADLEFPKKLAEVVKKTDTKVLQNIIMYRIFGKFLGFMGQKYKDIDFEYNKELFGVKEQPPHWKSCNSMAEKMEKAYGALYARNFFDQESKAIMTEMINNLKDSLTEMIKESTWMDKETKSKALLKIKEQIPLIGYSKYAFDDALLDEFYSKLDISESDDILTINEKTRIFGKFKSVEEYMKPVDRHEFFSQASVVNAYFQPISNAILFPAGILQFPMFVKDQPIAMNYGGMGTVIGHEITHGFDDIGKNYDDQGNLQNWWTEATLKQYKEKAQCMIDQYGAVEMPGTGGMKINGKLTIGENIGDNGGIRESYRAYQKFVAKNGEQPILPGIEVTGEQLFFYGYANFWCANQRIGTIKERLLSGSHSPNRFRTNIVLQNNEEFSKAFNCPLGSPMNPREKCSVW